jgi:WD40 repeat protein
VRFPLRGGLLAPAGKDGRVLPWDTATWRSAKIFNDDIGEANAVDFSGDGSLLASAGHDGRLVVRDVAHDLVIFLIFLQPTLALYFASYYKAWRMFVRAETFTAFLHSKWHISHERCVPDEPERSSPTFCIRDTYGLHGNDALSCASNHHTTYSLNRAERRHRRGPTNIFRFGGQTISHRHVRSYQLRICGILECSSPPRHGFQRQPLIRPILRCHG